MKNKKLLIILGSGTALLTTVVIVIFIFVSRETSLDFSVIDSNSKSWVYGLTAHAQNRVLKGFKTVGFTFHNLKPGSGELSLDAPSYESRKVKVPLFPGKNRLQKPIELVGYEIPGLAGFSIFENAKNNTLLLDIRLIGKDGTAVQDHPCIDVVLLARIQAQLVDGKPGPADAKSGAIRGEILFYGKADWKWNSNLSEVYRYSGSIPFSSIKTGVSPYWIIDYLFIVPDPRKITGAELDDIILKAKTVASPGELEKLLSSYAGKLVYFYKTNMNVEGK